MGIEINCRAIAEGVKLGVREKADLFEKSHGRPPALMVITVDTGDEASKVYVRNKLRDCRECNIDSYHTIIDDYPGVKRKLIYEIELANEDENVDGIIVQLPLPGEIHPATIAEVIDPAKDVDGITLDNTWALYNGDPCLEPCTPAGVMKVLNSYNLIRPGGNAVVIGRSMIVGRPMAMMLEHADMTVTLCHSKTKRCDLAHALETADVVVSAAGKPGLIEGAMLGNEPAVMDVGITRCEDGKLHGDCADDVKDYASFYTPVPGGIGLMTRAMLLSNTVKAAEARLHG